MAKRNVFLHVGPDTLEVGEQLRSTLLAAGVLMPDVGPGDLDRADLEIRRIHASAGLRRRDVEGAWAKVGRRTFKLRSDTFVSMPGFFRADHEQAALALDALMGMRVHLVTSAPELPAAWQGLVKASRVHVVGDDIAAEVAEIAVTERAARAQRKLWRLAA